MLGVWAVVLAMNVLSGNGQFVKDIKLFDVIDLAGAGVDETVGYHTDSKAYEFKKDTGSLLANDSVSAMFANQVNLVREFRVKAYLQTPADSNGGAIVFLSRGGQQSGVSFNVIFKWENGNVKVESVLYNKNSAGTLTCFFDKKQLTNARTGWLHLTVRVHMVERLIRCELERTYDSSLPPLYTYDGKLGDAPFNDFPSDGELRLAQQELSGQEHILDITSRFVGKLQDVIISFGDPNCTITVSPNKPMTVPVPTATHSVCPTPGSPAVKDDTCIDSYQQKHNDNTMWDEGKWTKCSCNKGKTLCKESVKRCLYRGEEYAEGATWDDLTNCDKCMCENGNSKCKSTQRVKKNDCERTCDDQSKDCPAGRQDGCYCPGKQVLYKGRCVDRAASCPCTRYGKEYSAGSHVVELNNGKCDYCICEGGKMDCIEGVSC